MGYGVTRARMAVGVWLFRNVSNELGSWVMP